jgi:hypothetical protein
MDGKPQAVPHYDPDPDQTEEFDTIPGGMIGINTECKASHYMYASVVPHKQSHSLFKMYNCMIILFAMTNPSFCFFSENIRTRRKAVTVR